MPLTDKFYRSLPKKRMAAGVLFLNKADEVLLVRPNYKEHWEVPGGNVHEDESPQAGALREVKEELGLDIKHLNFLCVDYAPASGPKDESLQFIFYGGVLGEKILSKIKLDIRELTEFKFVSIDRAKKMVKNHKIKTSFPLRIVQSFNSIKHNKPVYLEAGKNVES